MSNCDWGRPCDCRDCRTTRETVVCPNCQFENEVDIVRNVAGYSRDRKGIGEYVFSLPIGKKDLICYNCSFPIKDINYFDTINKYICELRKKKEELKREGLVCQNCQKTEAELSGFSFVKKLYKQKNGHLCYNCLKTKKNSENPSNEAKKYYLNNSTLKWELSKIRIACASCQRKRWLLAENTWKKYCLTCYEQLNKRSFSTFSILASNNFPKKQAISVQIVNPIIYQPYCQTKVWTLTLLL